MNNEFKKHYVLVDRLMDLEMALRESGVWECTQPSALALASNEPFCIDTMDFSQWLRYVMIVRFKALLETGGALPTRCQISPMAVESFKQVPAVYLSKITDALDRIDGHLSE
ncbi:MAG: YqcC family protein [Marinomonas sp.]